ncbi:MAG: DUF547 domain-containing protein [Vicingaceae bacterium]
MKKVLAVFLIILSIAFTRDNSPHIDHSSWNELLAVNVSDNGRVDYNGFKEASDKLKIYTNKLSKNPPTNDWSKSEAMAYWINAYNAFTVSLILKNYPLNSIMDINDGKAWDLKFIQIGGKNYSLNNIEHDILRVKYPDPRIHFAVNCAAQSCPKLNNEAFTAENLELSLSRLANEFINNDSKNKLSGNPIKVSKLFDWYKEDFTKKGTVIDYINKYSKTKVAASTKVDFMEYNWDLNN